jgi:hypothetical protein
MNFSNIQTTQKYHQMDNQPNNLGQAICWEDYGLRTPDSTLTSPLQPTFLNQASQMLSTPVAPQTGSRVPFHAFKKVFVPSEDRHYFKCSWDNCSKRFTRRAANSNSHWLRHTQLAPFVCELCSMGNVKFTLGFRRAADHKRHAMNSHYNNIVQIDQMGMNFF